MEDSSTNVFLVNNNYLMQNAKSDGQDPNDEYVIGEVATNR